MFSVLIHTYAMNTNMMCLYLDHNTKNLQNTVQESYRGLNTNQLHFIISYTEGQSKLFSATNFNDTSLTSPDLMRTFISGLFNDTHLSLDGDIYPGIIKIIIVYFSRPKRTYNKMTRQRSRIKQTKNLGRVNDVRVCLELP